MQTPEQYAMSLVLDGAESAREDDMDEDGELESDEQHDEALDIAGRILAGIAAHREKVLGWAADVEEDRMNGPEPVELTARGFGIWLKDLEDVNGQRIDVSESSLATEDAVRIYVTAGEASGLSSGCAHLNASQAAAVRDALNAWLLWIGDAAAMNPTEVA